MMSAPPAPSIVSLPVPPVSVFAAVEPVMLFAAETAEASTLIKLETLTESTVVWSALPRLTVAATFRSSVFVPVPPSIDVSDPR